MIEYMAWTPLFNSILDSSVWLESKETRLVWITMLAKKDKDGFVRGVTGTLARDAGVTLEECTEALRVLSAPDEISRTKEHEGRRIEAASGGWQILNHKLYREILNKQRQRAQQREWQRQHREQERKNGGKRKGSGGKKALLDHLEKAYCEAERNGDQAACDRIAAENLPSHDSDGLPASL